MTKKQIELKLLPTEAMHLLSVLDAIEAGRELVLYNNREAQTQLGWVRERLAREMAR